MKILLRDTDNGLYYRGASQWTPESEDAVDLVRTQAAVRLACNFRLHSAEVIIRYDEVFEEIVARVTTPGGGMKVSRW
jgi:hypothetical protein